MTAPCRQMDTCSQLTVKQEEDKGKTTQSDIEFEMLHPCMESWRLEKHSTDDFTVNNNTTPTLCSLTLPYLFLQHPVLPALSWLQAHFILWHNSGLVPSSVVWHYQLHSGLRHVWRIANVFPAVWITVSCVFLTYVHFSNLLCPWLY